MQRILLLDNYDSFTYNLAHYLRNEGVEVDVILNDHIDLGTLDAYDKIVLSPGPGLPEESGRLKEVIQSQAGKKPVFGICLGMQALAEYLNDELYNQEHVKHGVVETITITESPLFEGVGKTTEVGLYHSWAVKGEGEFSVTARSLSGVVMAIENKAKKIYGVQFHPESVMTPQGKKMIHNFLKIN